MERLYSDYTKNNIEKCFNLMLQYVDVASIESEEAYCNMRVDIRKMQIVIPKEIYEKINTFADDFLAPIIYEEGYWDFLEKGELGLYDESGSFCLKDEQSTKKYCGLFLEKVIELQKMVIEFGMKELHSILAI